MTEQSDMDRASHALHLRREHDAMVRAIREVLAEDDAGYTDGVRLGPVMRGKLLRALPKKGKVV